MVSFEEACEKAKNFSTKTSDNENLELYGFFKQATIGDVNVAKPGMLDVRAKAKWEAWNAHKGMSQADAKEAYVKVYEKYAAKYA